MTEEEKRQLQERLEQMFPEEYERSKQPFFWHEGRQTLVVSPGALADAIRYAEENSIDDMELSGEEIDLSPFADADKIHALSLTGSFRNTEALHGLPLTHLHIDNSRNKTPIDLSEFPMLERLSLDKCKRNITGLSKCSSLREICLYHYAPAGRDLTELRGLTNLCQVSLVHPRIDSLQGVEELNSLEKLLIAYSKTLRSLERLPTAIKHLEIDHCPNVDSYLPIESLRGLEMLFIRACKTMDTRAFLQRMPGLKHVFISKGTVIRDENGCRGCNP